jgi:hypothetical protein
MKRFAALLLCLLVFSGLKRVTAQESEVLFSDMFESGMLDPAFWQAVPGDVVEVASDDGVPHGGIFGVRMGKRTEGGPTTNALDLRLDLSGREQVELSFWISSIGEETNVEDGIWFSADGGATFIKVFDFDPAAWTQRTYGQFPPLDVDRLAAANGLALTATFVIRFQQHGISDFDPVTAGVSDGIYLDDVEVRTAPETYTPLPFEESFETGILASPWHWGDPSLSLPPGLVLPDGLVEVVSNEIAPHSGLFAAALGRRTEGNETTNALDLRLDLSNHQQVMLGFWMYNNGGEVNPQGDGVWFSADGGATFRHVFTYDIPPREYQQRTLDVDTLAATAGLSLSERFVVRFQQHGTSDFDPVTAGVADGIYLDDISVTGTFVPPGVCGGLPATVSGTHGNDVLQGTEGDDVVVGMGGDDVIEGGGGNDMICAGQGTDIVFGGEGNDRLFGGPGEDVLLGEGGDDTVFGEAGDDFLFGGAGLDTLDGGGGNNITIPDE